MSYRGPQPGRITTQASAIHGYAGETATWRAYVSAAPTSSAYFAGKPPSSYYAERTITALWASPQVGEARFREMQLPAGQMMAGDVVASTPDPMGTRDEVIWRGVTYRVEGDATPVHMGGRVWYRTVLRRGDATG